jgi:hypothetical protein
MIQQMLQQVGIKVEIQTSEFGTFLEDVQKGNFQMYSLSRNGIADPDFYNVIFSTASFPPEGQNRGYYSNPRVDKLITEGRSTFDRPRRKQIYGEIQRIVQEDLVIPPVSVPVALNVFCVEHGRWTPRTAGYNSGGGGSAPRVAAPETAARFDSLGAVAHPKLRAAAQDKKVQGEVWKEVSENNAKLGTANGTDTYQEVYKSGRVGAQMEDYLRVLEREVLQPGVVGVVVARNGKAVWADVFASHRMFASYWPKLLKSYVVDALGDDTSDKRPTPEEASRYLREREGTVTATTQAGVYQLVKTEQVAYAVFELQDISLASPLRLHFNKMDR